MEIRPNFTLSLGLRYVRDTGRTDSDIGPIAALAQFDNQFYSGLENRVHQPSYNFAPQLGFAWDPWSRGKTVIRGGIGLFYENSIWNNNLFDRPGRLAQGLFLGLQPACNAGSGSYSFCGQPVGTVASQIVAAEQAYQAATVAAGPAVNGTYVGNILADGIDITSTNLFAPDYITPRSVQMNIGVQHEIRRGMVLTVDYLRNVATHNLLTVDTNHIGAASFRGTSLLNVAAAQNAISRPTPSLVAGTASIRLRPSVRLARGRTSRRMPAMVWTRAIRCAVVCLAPRRARPPPLSPASIQTSGRIRCCFRLAGRFTTACK